MNSPSKPIALATLGTLPFIYALAISAYGFFDLNALFDTELRFSRFKSYMVAHTYGAVIVGFLGGIQWGISLNQATEKQYFIISNVLALLAWFSLFAFASFIGISTILLAFILALLIDRYAHQAGLIPSWFWQLRIRISGLVITTLMLLLFFNR